MSLLSKLFSSDSKSSSADFSEVLKKIADQTPSGVKVISINLEKNVGGVTIQLNGQAQNNNDLAVFTLGLKQDPSFSNVNYTSISFEKGLINFSINALFKLTGGINSWKGIVNFIQDTLHILSQ